MSRGGTVASDGHTLLRNYFSENLNQLWRVGPHGIMLFDYTPPGASHSRAQLALRKQTLERLVPIVAGSRRKPYFIAAEYLRIDADRGNNDRKADSHILQRLKSALSFAPFIVPQWHESYIHLLDHLHFIFGRPRNKFPVRIGKFFE